MKPFKIPRALGCFHLGVRGMTPGTRLFLVNSQGVNGRGSRGSLALSQVFMGGSWKVLPFKHKQRDTGRASEGTLMGGLLNLP